MDAKDSPKQAMAYKPIDKADRTFGNGPESLLSKTEASATGEKSVAGRKKMKGGEKWDMATGKEAAMVVDKEGSSKEPGRKETQEEHDIEVELNSILKKGPSKSPSESRLACGSRTMGTQWKLSVLGPVQSSYSQSPTAPIPPKRNPSCWRNTPSSPLLMWWN